MEHPVGIVQLIDIGAVPSAHADVATVVEEAHAHIERGVHGAGAGAGLVEFGVGVGGIDILRDLANIAVGIDGGDSRGGGIAHQQHAVQEFRAVAENGALVIVQLRHIVDDMFSVFH